MTIYLVEMVKNKLKNLVVPEVDTNAEDRSRVYATGPDFILNYLFLSCHGTGPIFV